jgi:hypothetical protein
MDLQMETLDALEAPLSNDFWTGFAIGAATVLGAAAVVAGMVVLT